MHQARNLRFRLCRRSPRNRPASGTLGSGKATAGPPRLRSICVNPTLALHPAMQGTLPSVSFPENPFRENAGSAASGLPKGGFLGAFSTRMPAMDFETTCWTVVRGAAAGHQDDRDRFARQYAPLIRRYLASRWRLAPDHDRVVEASHEAVIQLFKPGGALTNIEHGRDNGFRAFLYGVVRNVALMIERSARRNDRVQTWSDIDPATIEDSEASLSRVFARAWFDMIATEARNLMAARPGERCKAAYRCLELRYLDGIPPRDIAKRIGLHVKDVYELLRTGRNEYRAALLEVMATYYPDATESELEQRCRELAI